MASHALSVPLKNVRLARRAIALLDLRSRNQVEDLIEQLIAKLDALDGDSDLEDGDVDCCECGDDDVGRPSMTGLEGIGSDDDHEDDAPADGRLAHRTRGRSGIRGQSRWALAG